MKDKGNKNMNKIINNFMLKNPKVIRQMVQCTHAYNETILNPFHIEGSIWTHTLMVCKEMEIIITKDKGLTTEEIKELKWAALLHDIAKPITRYINKEREMVMFMGHESFGMFRALDVLGKEDTLSEKNKINIILLIGLHSFLQKNTNKKVEESFVGQERLLNSVQKLYRADNDGRYIVGEIRGITDKYTIQEKTRLEYNNTINILIGPHLSGKTMYVNNVKSDKFIISRDALLKRHFGDLGKSIKQIKTKFNKENQDRLNCIIEAQIVNAVKSGKEIFIDASNLSKQEREIYINNKLLVTYKKKAIIFVTSYGELMSRNRDRKRVPNFIIEKECKRLSIPFYNEFDEILYKIN